MNTFHTFLSALSLLAVAVGSPMMFADPDPKFSVLRDADLDLSNAHRAAEGAHRKQLRYIVLDLGTLGGTLSLVGGTNRKGVVSGSSLLAGDTTRRAFLWRKGQMVDLGTLGGTNSSNDWRPNDKGEVAGNAETSTPDPLGEDFCGFGTGLICRGFVWSQGVMTALPTLGGNNSAAAAINNRGQVAGAAETTRPTPECRGPLQFLPLIWENGEIREVLPTIDDDVDGIAFIVTEDGRAIGVSINCEPARERAVLWQNGAAIDLGNLGGTVGNIALGINRRGQVVGFASLPDNATFHAFLWEGGAMTDLGTLPGDFASIANDIDGAGRVIGLSFDSDFNSRAFIWQDGVMKDLNDLIEADSTMLLLSAVSINSRGQIAGFVLERTTGETHAFLASPTE